jgi:hypothetical protein
MSRYNITKDNKQLVYGYDHALGYFYEINDLNEPEDSSKHLIEEKSHFINGLSRNQFSNVLSEWGARETHMMALALDQPF